MRALYLTAKEFGTRASEIAGERDPLCAWVIDQMALWAGLNRKPEPKAGPLAPKPRQA